MYTHGIVRFGTLSLGELVESECLLTDVAEHLISTSSCAVTTVRKSNFSSASTKRARAPELIFVLVDGIIREAGTIQLLLAGAALDVSANVSHVQKCCCG